MGVIRFQRSGSSEISKHFLIITYSYNEYLIAENLPKNSKKTEGKYLKLKQTQKA
jgi:hypothetical protein